MKVKELIERLQQEDPETDVMVPGYEGGYHNDLAIGDEEVYYDVHDEWYYGPHDTELNLYEESKLVDKESARVLIIGYYNKRD